MWRKTILAFFLIIPFFLAPSFAAADQLVPCGGVGEEPCQACHLVTLTSNIFNWLGVVLAIVFVIIVVSAGLYIVFSAGAVESKTKARRIITGLITGYIIFLAGWFFIDFLLKILVNDDAYGVWNEVQCVDQPVAQEWSRVPASTGVDPVTGKPKPLGESDSVAINDAVAKIHNDSDIGDNVATAASSYGMTPDEAKKFRGLIYQESSDCNNKVGPATNYGRAYGCTQVLVSTARQMDPSLKGMSDNEVAKKLENDNGYSISIGAKYFKSLSDKYNGDTDKALAAYNGGPGANSGSRDCPGLARWQCEWDSPGCYNTGKTDCKRNEGFSSYEQTRNYVKNINNMADKL